MNTAGSILNTG